MRYDTWRKGTYYKRGDTVTGGGGYELICEKDHTSGDSIYSDVNKDYWSFYPRAGGVRVNSRVGSENDGKST